MRLSSFAANKWRILMGLVAMVCFIFYLSLNSACLGAVLLRCLHVFPFWREWPTAEPAIPALVDHSGGLSGQWLVLSSWEQQPGCGVPSQCQLKLSIEVHRPSKRILPRCQPANGERPPPLLPALACHAQQLRCYTAGCTCRLLTCPLLQIRQEPPLHSRMCLCREGCRVS